MRVRLEYGRSGLEVELPDENVKGVLRARHAPPLENPRRALEQALQGPIGCPPLADLARGKRSACIVVCDITRPVPNAVILPPLLRTLEESGMAREDITILIATGMHRPNEGEELVEILGPEIPRLYRVVNHHCDRDEEQVYVGRTSRGVDVYVDRTYVEADLKVITGLIEPHFMAGYSGGRKVVCPGITSLKTVQYFHSPALLEDPRATNGVLEGNPLHEMSLEVCRLAGVDFSLNVVIDEERRITGVFAGELEAAHEAGVRFVDGQVRVAAPEPADVVITTNGGYPLDATFYQAVKGMVGALPVVKEGGVVLIASELSEGIGSPEFRRLLYEMKDWQSFVEMILQPGFFVKDQWEVEMLCKVLRKAEVWLYSHCLPPQEARRIHVTPVPSVEEGVAQALQRFGPRASLLVIPAGPYIIPYVGGGGPS